MRVAFLSVAFGIGLLLSTGAPAQTGATVTATCKDGTPYSGTSRYGACRGHKGVASWGTSAATTSPAAASTNTAPTSTVATNTARPAVPKAGAPGQVWVNTSSKIYHCPGTRYYGKTKQGEYMTEVDAKAAGDRPSNGKACS